MSHSIFSFVEVETSSSGVRLETDGGGKGDSSKGGLMSG